MISTGSVICAILPFVRRYRPMLNRTLNIARRGSTNTVGCPNVGLNLLSLAVASSAVLFSAFSTSAINSIRPNGRCESAARPADPGWSAARGVASLAAPGGCAGCPGSA